MKRARTLRALTRKVVGLSQRQPVLLLIEDAHWIDPTTLELLELCLDAIATAPVLMVITSRPDHQPALASQTHVTCLSLNRLTRVGTEAIIARLGGGHLPRATIEALIDRSDRVPLYVEELTKTVLETGQAAIPASLYDSLMARLDRTPEVKEVAQIAACIGREFEHGLLAAVTGQLSETLADAVDQLVEAELVFRRGTPPDLQYCFKHALVRDAAYQSILKTRRRELHHKLALALQGEALKGQVVQPESIAQHFAAAGQNEAALEWWVRAGDQARGVYANREAIGHYGKAVEGLATFSEGRDRDRMEMDLRLKLSGPLFIVYGHAATAVEEHNLRLAKLCRSLDDQPHLLLVLYDLARNALQRPDLDRASHFGEQLLKLGKESAEPNATMAGAVSQGYISFLRGKVTEARTWFADARSLETAKLALARPAPHFQPDIGGRLFDALAAWLLGEDKDIQGLLDEVNDLNKASNSPFIWIFTLQREAMLFASIGDAQKTRSATERFFSMQDRYPSPHYIAPMRILNGWARMREGEIGGAYDEVRPALVAWKDRQAEVQGTFMRGMAAEVFVAAGDHNLAQDIIDEAISLARHTGEAYWLPELYRIDGINWRSLGDLKKSQERFLAAIDAAKLQKTRALELRAATTHAEALVDRGERQQVLDLLLPLIRQFHENSATPDLRRARLLIASLTGHALSGKQFENRQLE